MSAPIEPQGSALDELLSDEPLSAPARPSVLDSLRSSVGTDPTRYNQAVQEVPISASPRFAAENPEWYEDRDLKKQARLIEERPRLRQSLERDPETVARIGAGRVEQIARAHDTLQEETGLSEFFGQVAQTGRATVDQVAITAMQYERARLAHAEMWDVATGGNFGGALNRQNMREMGSEMGRRSQSMEGLSLAGQIVALGSGQVVHMVPSLASRAAAGAVLSSAGPVGTGVGLAAGGALPTVFIAEGNFFADGLETMPDVPKEDLLAMSVMVGLFEGSLELLPVESLAKTASGRFQRDAVRLLADRDFRDRAGYVLKRIAAQAMSEAPVEALQEVPATLVPLVRQYINGEIEFEGIIEGIEESELFTRMGESARMGAIGSILPASMAVGVSSIGSRRRVEEAQSNREVFQKIADAAVDNREIIAEMPERYHQLMEEAIDENGQVEGIYIKPEALIEAYEGEGAVEFAQLAENVPGLAERIELAEETGGKVRLSPADFATYVAPSERFQKLADDLSFNEDQGSLRESFEATKPENIEKIKAQLTLLREAAGVDPERDVALEQDFVQNLSAIFDETIPAVSAPVREKNAQLLGRIVMQISEMDGSDPLEAMSDLLDRVQFEQRPELDSPGEVQRSGQVLREGGDPQVLGQETAEVAVDINGSELTGLDGIPVPVNADGTINVYHRTTAENAARIEETGQFVSKENTGEAFFSSRREGQAAGYGDTVVEVRLDPSTVRLDDAFPDGEIHLAADVSSVRATPASRAPETLRQEEEEAPKNSNEHLLMVQREEREVGDTGSVKWFKGERGLIKANAKKIAKKIRGDGKRPSKKQVDAVVQQIETYVAFEKARHPPVAGWTSWEYAKSEPKKDDDGKVKLDKEGNVVFQHQPKKQPYQFDKDKKGKALKKGARTRAVRSLANQVHEEIRKVAARAASGDAAANVHIRQAGWYREMRATLRRDFGGLGDLFADLLGATSPQTPVRANWTNASEALSMASSGEFDSLIDQWEEWVEGIENAEQAFLEWIAEQKSAGWKVGDLKETGQYKRLKQDMADIRALPDNLNPRKRNGKKFGANGKQVVKTMVNLWRTVKKPDTSIGRGSTAPKAQNFSGNLIGFREGATIDVWAARFLQRLRWGNKIPSKAEGGVQGDVLSGGETTGQFRFGQDVFEAAAELIRNDSDLAGVESFANMNPDDLQAVVWFVEKEVWTIADATSGEGEGGSFEFESWLAGSTQFERIDELRKIIGAKRSTLPEKEAARQELELFERRLDRFMAGLSLETGAWLQGVNFSPNDGEMAAVSARLLEAIHSTDPDGVFVVGSKTASTVGLYGEPERSFDLEIVAREGYDLGAFRRRVFEEARDAQQDSAFVSRVLRDGEDIDYKRHRPGIEVYFRESKPLSEIDPILAELTKILPAGYTVSVDARRSRSARDGEMPSVVGIRAQYIPEFEVRWGGNEQRASPLAGLTEDELASHVRDQGDRMDSQVFRILEGVDGVTFAGTLWHETEVVFEGDYDKAIAKGQSNADSSAGTRAQDRSSGGDGLFGESVATGIESAARRIEAVDAAQGQGEIPFGGNAQQPGNANAGRLQRSGSPGERGQEHEANHRRLGLLDDSGNPVSLDDLHQGTKTAPSVQRAVYRAMGLSAVDGQDTNAGLKIYPLQDVFSGDPAEVDAQLQTWLNSIGWTYKVFGPGQGEGGKPLYPDFQDPNTLSYENKVAWIFDPTNEEGSFRDHAYTLAWRVTHEIAHGLVEAKLTEKYGEGRRAGAMGVVIRGPHYKQDSPRSLSDAMRAVEWEHEAFIEQRRILSEQFGIEISDEQFLLENSINMSDAVYRAITGQFGSPGDLGVTPKAIGNGEILDNAFDILETLSQEIESAPAERDAPTVLKQDAADATNAAVDAFNRGDIGIFRQPAYHGSGSRFDKFSTDFMGTGEGAQAFGWGLYFSSSRGIAEFYRNQVAQPSWGLLELGGVKIYKGPNKIADYGPDSKDSQVAGLDPFVVAEFQEQMLIDEGQLFQMFNTDGALAVNMHAVNFVNGRLRDAREEGDNKYEKKWSALLKRLTQRKPRMSADKTSEGQVFEVDIPEDNELMNWDAPLSEQPESIKPALAEVFNTARKPLLASLEAMSTEEIQAFAQLIDPNGDYEAVDVDGEEISESEHREILLEILLEMDVDGDVSSYMGDPISSSDQKMSGFYTQLKARLGSDRAASEALAAAGIKGHKYQANQISGGPGTATNYVIYDDAAISIAETFYSQSQEAKPSTRGQLIVDRRIQKFLLQLSEKKVNDSTLTHEIFHLALELVLDASERPGAGPEINEFREQILNFLNVDSREQIGRDQHERWAESGEVYMASGQAPTAELRNLFRFFFQRFKQVYRAIRDQLQNADPNNDFVPIFDRLLASEDQIRREANRDNVVAPMLAPELTELMTGPEEEELRRNLEAVNASERAKLESTIAKEDERILKAQMGELKTQVREEIYGRREHKLALWLRTGRTVTGDPIDDAIGLRVEGEHKMNGELLDEASGDVSTRKSLGGMVKVEGGLSPDAVAIAGGYNSTDEMLVELLAMEPSEDLIARIIHERAEVQGIVSTPEQLREAAAEKVDGQARDRLYAAQRRIARRLKGQMPAVDRVERKRLQGQAAPTVAEAKERVSAAQALLDESISQGADPGRIEGIQADIVAAEAGVVAAREARADQAQARRESRASRSKMPVQAIRAAARELVNELEFGQLKREMGRFKKMRAKASIAQTEAAVTRDWDALEQAIDQEQLSNALAEEAAKRLEDVNKYKRLIESFDKPKSRKRARLSKHGDYEDEDGAVTNVMDVIDGLLSMVSFKNISLRKIERAPNVALFAKLVEDSNGIVLPLPNWVSDVLDRPNYKKMKVSDLEDLYVGIKALEKFGMDMVLEREGIEKVAEQEEVDALLGTLEQQKPVLWAGKNKFGESQRSISAKVFGGIIGAQMSFESIADLLDNLNPEGNFNRFFMHRFKAAAREEERLRKLVSQKVNAAWDKYSPVEKREFYSKPIKIHSLGESLVKNEIMAIAANMGNPHNRAAVMDAKAYGLTEVQIEEILSHVTERDADYLQSVLDAVNLLWEPAAAAEKEMNGVVPPKVQGVPWTLPSGRVMKGGYFPLMFDPALAERSAEHQAREIGKGLMPAGGGAAMTKVGSLKARKRSSGGLTIRTDFHAVLQKHVNSMSKDIAWRNTIVKADRQLRKLAPELKRVLGEPFYRQMRNYLKRQGTPLREGDQGPPDFVIKTARQARKGLGLTVMAWRLTQAAIQWSGFVTAIPRVGAANIAWGWADVTSTVWNWDRITQYRELIPELKNRAETFDRDAQQETLRLKPIDIRRPFSSLDTIQAFSANVGYTLLGMIDTVTSTAVAAGAMHQAMSGQVEGIAANDVEASVRYAGKIIDRTQGSGGTVNTPSMLDNGEMMKLITPFMSFVNAQAQQAIVYGALGARQVGDPTAARSMIPGVPKEAARFVSFWLWAYLMESLLSEGTRYMIKGLLGPDEPDEDAFFNTVVLRSAMGPFGAVPLVRELETISRGFKPDTPLSSLLMTAYNATVKPAVDIAEGDYDGERHIRALATGITYATGLPSKQALDAIEVLTQESFGRGR